MLRLVCLIGALVLGSLLAVGMGVLEMRRMDQQKLAQNPVAEVEFGRPAAVGPAAVGPAAVEPAAKDQDDSQPNAADATDLAQNDAPDQAARVAEGELALNAGLPTAEPGLLPAEPDAEMTAETAEAAAVEPASYSASPTIVEPPLEALVDSPASESPAQPTTPAPSSADSTEQTDRHAQPVPELFWHDDYQQAYREAKDEGRMLFIYFHDPRQTSVRQGFENRTLAHPLVRDKLADYVLLKTPTNGSVTVGGQPVRLLSHPAFAEMLGSQGVAIIDLANRRKPYYGQVVSTFPFTRGKYYRGAALDIILTLPPGTLTQRTMIYAVRTHPEAPASTQGTFHNLLANEAQMQSLHQASILNQGHHNWDSRFQRITAQMPAGVTAQEVVAESWPNESLVDACVDCVDSWRQSPGHWNAVRSRHPLFGFDIQRGRNGIWYATGIFGRH